MNPDTFRRGSQRPTPPQSLSKETVGVWAGWCNIGDKEVAREAAAKGSHIKLAITFLSLRKNVSYETADDWFKAEVTKWVSELLERKQIFKVSHIYSNIGLDPPAELIKVFYSTCDSALREAIASHLIKIECLSDHLRDLWTFLNLILENVVFILKYKLPQDSIECLDQQTDEWKAEIATTLFLKLNDNRLVNFLQAEILWKHLLANNDLDSLLLWVNLRYDSNFEEIPAGNLVDLFRKFPIHSEMIDSVGDSADLADDIYTELSKFGIFCSSEQSNVLAILKRLTDSRSIANLNQILSKPSSVISLDSFIKLFIDYCLENNLLSILNSATANYHINAENSPELEILCDFRKLVSSNFAEISLKRNVFHVSCVLSTGDLVEYFNQNPIIFLSLILFAKNVDFIELVSQKTSPTITGTHSFSDYLPDLLENLPILEAISQNFIAGRHPDCLLTVYDLLDRHLAVNSGELFKFRFSNKPVPNFNSAEIVDSYGYCKRIDYKFYLLQSRPSSAAKHFILGQLELFGDVKEDELRKVEKKAQKLSVSHFQNAEIAASCITFLEIINRDSSKLRIVIKSSGILLQAGYASSAILEILQNCDDEPYQLQTHLETVLMAEIEAYSLKKGDHFVKALKIYEIVVQYSKLSNIKLPELFLKHCAGSNLWLPFLVFAQIHNYPIDQLKLLIQFFKSPNMLEHLTHGVLTDIHSEREKTVTIRKNFLSRVGVRKSIDEVLQMAKNPSVASQSSHSSGGSVYGPDFFEIDISNIKATLLQTLIRCHNSTDPPKALLQACQLYRNPLLAVLATSYEPDSVVTNWLTWLAVSCCLCQTFTNFESRAVSASCVASLVVDSMKKRYPKSLLESFQIFLPENPLRVFVDFLNDLVRFELKPVLLKEKLESFESLLKSTRKNSVWNETDHEMTFLSNRVWIESVALRLLAAVINHNCDSLHDQIILVDFLHEINLWKYTEDSDDCPNLNNLSRILKSLTKSNVPLEICEYFDRKDRRQAVVDCINSLLEKHQYGTALEIAQIEKLPPDLILVKEWQSKITYKTDSGFWLECDGVFACYNVSADCVVDFYMEQSEKIVESLEKFTVLKMAWTWASNSNLGCQYEIETKMWLSFLCLDDKHKNLELSFVPQARIYSYKELCVFIEKVSVYEGPDLSKDFLSQLEKVVNFALNKCDFWLALRVQKIFSVKSPDLETLKLAHSLAEGILLPYQLNTQQRLLLSNVNQLRGSYGGNRRTFLSTRLSSFSSSSHSPANASFAHTPDTSAVADVSGVSNDTLAILKVLSESLHSGVVIGQTIFMMFRISINIEIPYQVVTVAADHMKILKDSLEDDCMHKLDVVHDFILVYKWTKPAIADFICDELITAISNHLEDQHRLDQCLMWDVNITNDFQMILQLLQDNCSLLGHKLYIYLNTLLKSRIESGSVLNSEDFGLVIELLIKAHDCFTADCNMEGISLVLKKSKEVVANLLTLQDWKSIVRLATGVGRYTEMNYVFQILKENDQFEFLLRKGLRKDNSLKVALLEYLKKFCPDNRDLYKIVALHFTLFSEVALLWETEAENVIKNLITISRLEMQNNKVNVDDEPFTLFQNTESTQICLKKAMDNYKHATDFHLQGEKLTKAMESAKQAELIALQLGRLNEIPAKSSTICLLNLSSAQLAAIVLSKFSFEQCLRLVEAYNFHPDWSSILHEQYIVKNNIEFFDAFLQHLPLTDTLANDISRKFIHPGNSTNSINEIRAMKNILSRLPSVHAKYRIASELGFTDLVEDLIASGQLIYLKDTVWKKGYKS